MNADRVTIEGTTVQAQSSEGATAAMPIDEFMDQMNPPAPNTADVLLPEGVRLTRSNRSTSVFVWEIPPRIHRVSWIAADSPAPFRMAGAQVKYEPRSLALPYLLIFAVFTRDRLGRLVLSGHNEAYFRTRPLQSMDDELCFTGLLNVSKFPKQFEDQQPLAWICTQYAPLRQVAREKDLNQRVRKSLDALRHTVLETGFNYSSEHHELTSYWSYSKSKVPGIRDIDAWEQRSRENPLHVLDVKWLPARCGRRTLTVRTLIDRIFRVNNRGGTGGDDTIRDAAGLARIVHQAAARSRRRRAG